MNVQTQSPFRVQWNATRAAFFIPGFAIAAWAPIVPLAKARAGLDEATLGFVLLCLGMGSLLSMPLAGALAASRGCRTMLVVTALLICATLPILTLVESAWLLSVTLFVFGVGLGAMDCSMNLQAVMVERDSGRAMMSGFHAFYSIGGFAGAAGMTALLSAGLAPWVAGMAASVVILALLTLFCAHWRRERVGRGAPAFAWPRGVVVFIGLLCFIVFLAEGAMLDWSAVFLHEVRGVEASRSGLGFTVFSLTMTATRLLGDGLVGKLGRLQAVMLGGICSGAGLFVMALMPTWEAAVLGCGMMGLGCANIVPVMFSLAGSQKTMPESLAIPAVVTLGYGGVLAGPALIGFFAQATSLVAAFICIAIVLLGVAGSVRWLED